MPRDEKIDQFEAPIDLAMRMLESEDAKMENYIFGADQIKRPPKIGDQEAEPIIDSVVNMVPEA